MEDIVKKMQTQPIITEVASFLPLQENDINSTFIPETEIRFKFTSIENGNTDIPLRIENGILGTLVNDGACKPYTEDDIFLMIRKNQYLDFLQDLENQLNKLRQMTIYGSFKISRTGNFKNPLVEGPQSSGGKSHLGTVVSISESDRPNQGGLLEIITCTWGKPEKMQARFSLKVRCISKKNNGILENEDSLLEDWDIIHIYIQEEPQSSAPREGVLVIVSIPNDEPSLNGTTKEAIINRFKEGMKSQKKAAVKAGFKLSALDLLFSSVFFLFWLIGQTQNDDEILIEPLEMNSSTFSNIDLFGELLQPGVVKGEAINVPASAFLPSNDLLSLENETDVNPFLLLKDDKSEKFQKNNDDLFKGG